MSHSVPVFSLFKSTIIQKLCKTAVHVNLDTKLMNIKPLHIIIYFNFDLVDVIAKSVISSINREFIIGHINLKSLLCR